ncbi:MAG: lysine biosynthesis protein LysW [Candidatus Aminicenantia bacterium]
MSYNGVCPICDASLSIKEGVLISEILSCPDCNSLLVVENIENHTLKLGEAPKIEEDWGE